MLQSTELIHPFPDPPASPYPDRLGSSSLTATVQGQLWTGLKVTKTLKEGLDPLSTNSEQPEGEQKEGWEGLGLYTEPSRKVQGGVLGTNDLIALVLGGTSTLIWGKCMQPVCDACCSTLTMLLALAWTEIHGHCVLGNFWLRVDFRIYPGGTLRTVCASQCESDCLLIP